MKRILNYIVTQYNDRQAINENILYTLVWFVVLIAPLLNHWFISGSQFGWEYMFACWLKSAPYILVFFLHNTFISPLMLFRDGGRQKYISYLLLNTVSIVLIFGAATLLEMVFDIENGSMVVSGSASVGDLSFSWNLLFGWLMCGANLLVKIAYMRMRDEKNAEVVRSESLQAEMDYLKYQLNPHFFMNTLNNIHTLIDIDSEQAKDAILNLSSMMRCVLYDSSTKNISLNRDVKFLRDYIALMRMRYGSAVEITFDYSDNISENTKVAPLLFIVFVENAFKHGISCDAPSFIHISVYVDDRSEVHFHIVNSRHGQSDGGGIGGVGLKNVRKRLDIIYGENYKLFIDDSSTERYLVELTIPAEYD